MDLNYSCNKPGTKPKLIHLTAETDTVFTLPAPVESMAWFSSRHITLNIAMIL